MADGHATCMVCACSPIGWGRGAVPMDTALRAAGWAAVPYRDGVRYVCPGCRSPRPKVASESREDGTQLDLLSLLP